MNALKKIIIPQIQSQMEHAVECLNEKQPGAAQLAFLECAALCQQLELERTMARTSAPEQLTIDISTTESTASQQKQTKETKQ